MFDNRIFNVNGSGKEMLLSVLKLAFQQEGPNTTCNGYIVDPVRGMILLWAVPDGKPKEGDPTVRLPAKYTPESVLDFVWTWLESKPKMGKSDCHWDEAYEDGDVWNEKGWRVYCQDWGHIESSIKGHDGWRAIVAVRPVNLWLGK